MKKNEKGEEQRREIIECRKSRGKEILKEEQRKGNSGRRKN